MSKSSFSEKIIDVFQSKLKGLRYNPNTILESSEYYELALCLAYFTLSKEKIIHKDMKNNKRLERLTKKLDSTEIDKVFQEGFAEKMPVITNSLESDNTWILDNIRDSIMHGMFEVDEERKVFIIHNDYYDRDFDAEIPFSWIIAYAKNDILTKRIADKYNVTGCFYNKYRSHKPSYNTEKELNSNIFYKAYIKGNSFNVCDVEKRVRELFEIYSRDNIDQNKLVYYLDEIHHDGFTMYEGYYLPYYITKGRVKETIENEYPGLTVDINVFRRKGRFISKETKRLPKTFNSYEVMIDTFNRECSSKSVSLLEYLSLVISNLNTNNKSIDLIEFTSLFNILGKQYNSAKDINKVYNEEMKMLESLLLNVLGIATLVINYNNLNDKDFLNSTPSTYDISAISKSNYMDYATKVKACYKEILELEIKLAEKKEQYNNAPDSVKSTLLPGINNIISRIATLYQNIERLASDLNIIPEYRDYEKNDNLDRLSYLIMGYHNHLNWASKKKDKIKIKKIIFGLLEKKIEEESKTMFSRCNTMQETLEIIRNGFSHIGRVRINDQGIVIINDYDENKNKTGEVICHYDNLLELLISPNLGKSRTKEKDQ